MGYLTVLVAFASCAIFAVHCTWAGNKDLSQIISKNLARNRLSAKLLESPLNESAIDAITDSLPFDLPKSVKQFYLTINGIADASFNGTLTLKETWIIPGYYILSLQDAVETYNQLVESNKMADDTEQENRYNPDWFPVFASGAGDYYIVDSKDGTVYLFMKDVDTPDKPDYASLEDMLKDHAEDWSRGLIHEDKENMIYSVREMSQIELEESQEVSPEYRQKRRVARHGGRGRRPTRRRQPNHRTPILRFPCQLMPAICNNIYTAIRVNRKPTSLTRTTNRSRINANRRAACGHVVRRPGFSCDEYPFASTLQGGRGSRAVLVPARENNRQGGILAGFYRRNNIKNGGRYRQAYS